MARSGPDRLLRAGAGLEAAARALHCCVRARAALCTCRCAGGTGHTSSAAPVPTATWACSTRSRAPATSSLQNVPGGCVSKSRRTHGHGRLGQCVRGRPCGCAQGRLARPNGGPIRAGRRAPRWGCGSSPPPHKSRLRRGPRPATHAGLAPTKAGGAHAMCGRAAGQGAIGAQGSQLDSVPARFQPLPCGLRGQLLRIHFVMSFCATGIQDPKIPTSPPPKIPRFQIGHFEAISHFVSGLEGIQDSKPFPKEGQGSFSGQTGGSEFILQ